MCGRFNLAHLTWRQLREWMLGVAPDGEGFSDRHNVPPSSPVPIARLKDDVYVGSVARWWLIPHWHRGLAKDWKATTFNARIETVATAPSFRDSYKSRRCIVFACGYYEWRTIGGAKVPFYVFPSGNEPAFCFAGLWTFANLPDCEGLTCTIITEPAHGGLAELHDRQPVILTRPGVRQWLTERPIEDVERLSEAGLKWHLVSDAVGSVKNDGPTLIITRSI